MKSQVQTEFADIMSTDSTDLFSNPEGGHGHLSVDYTCMKWLSLDKKVNSHILNLDENLLIMSLLCVYGLYLHVFVLKLLTVFRKKGSLEVHCWC